MDAFIRKMQFFGNDAENIQRGMNVCRFRLFVRTRNGMHEYTKLKMLSPPEFLECKQVRRGASKATASTTNTNKSHSHTVTQNATAKPWTPQLNSHRLQSVNTSLSDCISAALSEQNREHPHHADVVGQTGRSVKIRLPTPPRSLIRKRHNRRACKLNRMQHYIQSSQPHRLKNNNTTPKQNTAPLTAIA